MARIRAASLLFFSGATALAYQTLWVKQLSVVVGLDVYAITTAVAAFFAGLAFGSAWLGRCADRAQRPLAVYATLEMGIAVCGVGATLALARAAPVFVTMQDAAGALAWLLPLVLVGFPAFLMGGTLPALMRDVAPGDDNVGRASGVLYAANTAGAVAGTLASSFVLVPRLGIAGTALSVGVVNVVLAVIALTTSRQVTPSQESNSPESISGDARLAVGLYALAGGIALGYEIVWTQVIVQFLSTRTYAFSIVLSTYLVGLVLGSFCYAPLADRVRRPWLAFGCLIAGAGVSAAALFASLGPWLPRIQASFGSMVFEATESRLAMMCGRFLVAAVVLVLPTTILLGAAFPAVIRLTARPMNVGRDVGMVTAVNTVGGIAGTFLVGFIAIPYLGLSRTLGVLAVSSAVVGAVAILGHGWFGSAGAARGAVGRTSRAGVVSIAFATVMVVAVVVLAVGVPRDKLASLLSRQHRGTLVFYEEGPGGTVAVLEDTATAGTFRRLYIQGVSNSGDSLTSLRYMRLQALLPLLIHNGEPRSALVVGQGTGITAGSLLAYGHLDQRVCAELLPAVVRACELFEGNMNMSSDPRMEIRVRDGRHELLSSDECYDVITLEPPPPSASGVVNLYSRDFYELARSRLNKNGIFAQWWPLATQNDEDSQSLVRSFLDVFPEASLWTTEMHETLLIGSADPIKLDVEQIESRFEEPTVAEALRCVGIRSATELLSTYVTDRDGLESYAADALPVTDDRPRIEHADWVREGEFPRVLQRVAEMRSPIPLTGGDPTTPDRVERSRQKLWALYRAGYHAYRGEQHKWETTLSRLGPDLHRNPYFRWFVSEAAY